MAKLMLAAACALIDRDGRILLAKKPDEGDQPGKWEFPGGKLDEGETPEQALVRELKEELAIETEESCLAPIGFASHDLGEFHLLMPLFVCRKWTGAAIARIHQKIEWVRSNALLQYDLLDADRPLAAQLRDFL